MSRSRPSLSASDGVVKFPFGDDAPADEDHIPIAVDDAEPTESTPLIRGTPEPFPVLVASPTEEWPQTGPAHSHSHGHGGSMNMKALLLHVLGDALGNVGVIATGLIIWLTSWSFKYYFDPIISLVITVIIFNSALPLGTAIFVCTAIEG